MNNNVIKSDYDLRAAINSLSFLNIEMYDSEVFDVLNLVGIQVVLDEIDKKSPLHQLNIKIKILNIVLYLEQLSIKKEYSTIDRNKENLLTLCYTFQNLKNKIFDIEEADSKIPTKRKEEIIDFIEEIHSYLRQIEDYFQISPFLETQDKKRKKTNPTQKENSTSTNLKFNKVINEVSCPDWMTLKGFYIFNEYLSVTTKKSEMALSYIIKKLIQNNEISKDKGYTDYLFSNWLTENYNLELTKVRSFNESKTDSKELIFNTIVANI